MDYQEIDKRFDECFGTAKRIAMLDGSFQYSKTHEDYKEFWHKEIDRALKERDEEVRELIDDMQKSTSDTLSEDSAYYGYCKFCKDHVSQHGEDHPICGCDYYNLALEEILKKLALAESPEVT